MSRAGPRGRLAVRCGVPGRTQAGLRGVVTPHSRRRRPDGSPAESGGSQMHSPHRIILVDDTIVRRRRASRSRTTGLARLALVLTLAATTLVPIGGTAIAGGDRHEPRPAGPDAVLAWNKTATSTAIACGLSGNPLAESRLYAMTHVAIHDALIAIRLQSPTEIYTPSGLTPGASPEAAVATAARDILKTGLGGCATFSDVETAYAEALSAISDSAAKAAGIEVGTRSAAAVLAARASDGADAQLKAPADSGFTQGTQPGQWRFTLTADGVNYNKFAFLPKWGTVDPFVLRSSDQFAPNGPYLLDSRRYAKDLNEIKALGGKD